MTRFGEMEEICKRLTLALNERPENNEYMTNSNADKKLWSGRFAEETNALVDEFNASIALDARLYKHDIRGSIAHAPVLEKAGVLTQKEARRITSGLKAVEKEIASGALLFLSGMEDVHMAVEAALTGKIGPARRKTPHRQEQKRSGKP